MKKFTVLIVLLTSIYPTSSIASHKGNQVKNCMILVGATYFLYSVIKTKSLEKRVDTIAEEISTLSRRSNKLTSALNNNSLIAKTEIQKLKNRNLDQAEKLEIQRSIILHHEDDIRRWREKTTKDL